MFFALAGDEIIGCAGLEFDPDQPDRAEHAFTAVPALATPGDRLDAEALTLAFAAEHGVREVYTWTQLDNADMRALNERLGYVDAAQSITVRGPLPLAEVQSRVNLDWNILMFQETADPACLRQMEHHRVPYGG